MNATYIVETNGGGGKWEMAGGVYVVNAKSAKQAKGIVEPKLDSSESIDSVTRVDKRKKGILFSQHPVIE
jgi:hypothetical protein